MAKRTAQTQWQGGLEDGSGTTELASSRLGSYEISFPTRSAETADGATSPEELLAAAHSGCYSMQLSAFLAEAGGTVENITTDAEVALGPDPNGGFKLTGIALTVRAQVPGIEDDAFQQAAARAKAECPVSKALTGVEITLDAALT